MYIVELVTYMVSCATPTLVICSIAFKLWKYTKSRMVITIMLKPNRKPSAKHFFFIVNV